MHTAQAKALLEAAEEKKSQLEIMKEMRDYKRRRQKYRAKNVHITQKSIKDVSSCLCYNSFYSVQGKCK